MERRLRAEDVFRSTATAGEVFATLRRMEAEGHVDIAVRLAAVGALQGKTVGAGIQTMLASFSALLGDNPRAMKKLLNAYGIELEIRILDLPGDEDTLRQLALWTILILRWPQVAEFLSSYPDEVSRVGPDYTPSHDVEVSPDVLSVLQTRRVKDVVCGRGTDPPVELDAPTLRVFLGATTVQPPPATSETGAAAG
jgi:hypothetical protein